jgi:uncharacterized membrane protein (UPF0182 family)
MRQYYSFGDIDVDRFCEKGECRQIMIGARELDIARLKNPNWQKQFLIYSHGSGAGAVDVNSQEGQNPRLVSANLPVQTEYAALNVNNPAIYFGETTESHVYVGTGIVPEHDYPTDTEENVNWTTGAF